MFFLNFNHPTSTLIKELTKTWHRTWKQITIQALKPIFHGFWATISCFIHWKTTNGGWKHGRRRDKQSHPLGRGPPLSLALVGPPSTIAHPSGTTWSYCLCSLIRLAGPMVWWSGPPVWFALGCNMFFIISFLLQLLFLFFSFLFLSPYLFCRDSLFLFWKILIPIVNFWLDLRVLLGQLHYFLE